MILPDSIVSAARAVAGPFVQKKEELRLIGYRCPADVPTAGWGHTGNDVVIGRSYSMVQAQAWFNADLDRFTRAVCSALTREPTVHQLGAMIALCFNIGVEAFATSSVVRLFNAAKFEQAAKAFLLWRKITVVDKKTLQKTKVDSAGLRLRRQEEAAMFQTLDNQALPPVVETPDNPTAMPDVPAAVPQVVEAATPAGSVEKTVSTIIAGGGVTGALSLLEKASDKPASLAMLLVFVLLLGAAGVWYWRTRMRKG